MTAMQTGQRPATMAGAAAPEGQVDQIDEVLALLARWGGGMGMLWTYSISHGKLVIRLTRPGVKGNAHLSLYDCRRLAAPTFWGNTALGIAEEQTPDGRRFVVTDPAANVEVRCGYVVAAENVEPIY